MNPPDLIPTALTKVCQACGKAYSYDEAHSCTEGNTKLYQDDLPAVQPEVLLGAVLGTRYRIEEVLEGGGMGVVYRARHVTLDKAVAIKIMVMRDPAEDAARKRFLQEAILASRVHHSNVVDIFDFGVLDGGHLYLVMEFLSGRTLGEAIGEGPMSPLRACQITSQIARGVQAVHDKGIVHRDLKPDNVFLLERDGLKDFVKIVDFGIAKARGGPQLTQVGMVLGTPQYMSPEQVTGQEADHRADQYALGCVLYRMLTGTLPFDGESAAAIVAKHASDTVTPLRERRPDLDIPPSLEVVVLRAMAKRPEDRFSSMREMERALLKEQERLLAQQVSTQTRMLEVVPGGVEREPPRWRWAVFMVLGAAVTGIAMCGVAEQLNSTRAHRPSQVSVAAPPQVSPPAMGTTFLPDIKSRVAAGFAPAWLSAEPVEPVQAFPALPPAAVVKRQPDLSARVAAPERSRLLLPPPPARPEPVGGSPRAGMAAPRATPRFMPVRVRFQIRSQGDLRVTLSCTGKPALSCQGGCTVDLPEGGGECTASAPGSGYRAQSFSFEDLQKRARARKSGSITQEVALTYIKY